MFEPKTLFKPKTLVHALCCFLSTKVLVLNEIGKLFAKFDIDLFYKIF